MADLSEPPTRTRNPETGDYWYLTDGKRQGKSLLRLSREVLTGYRSDAYEYESLPSARHIRLLKIQPGSESDPIRCSLRAANLEKRPRYCALSYAWHKDRSSVDAIIAALRTYRKTSDARYSSDSETEALDDYRRLWAQRIQERVEPQTSQPESEKMHSIFCDGKKFLVTGNLYDLLLRLRKVPTREYWVDALCINQQHDRERNAQVKMMGRIYSTAEKVMVWLGATSAFSDSAVNLTFNRARGDSLADSEFPSLQAVWEFMSEEIPKDGADGKAKDGRDEKSQNTMRVFTAAWIVGHSWFRRVWIVQEYCLARDVMFLLGDWDISDSAMREMLSGLTTLGLRWHTRLLQIVPQMSTLVPNTSQMFQLRGSFTNGQQITLEKWLELIKGRRATDARDAVFAGLSLVDPNTLVINQDLQLDFTGTSCDTCKTKQSLACGKHSRLWNNLHADYSVETVKVLSNLAACIMTNYGWERVFHFALRFRYPPNPVLDIELNFPDVPSWIPNPSTWTSRVLEPVFLGRKQFNSLPSSPSRHASPRISGDGLTLLMTAAKVDKISSCFSTARINSDASLSMMMDLLKFILDNVPPSYTPNGRPGLEVLARVLIKYPSFFINPEMVIDDKALTSHTSYFLHKETQRLFRVLGKADSNKEKCTKLLQLFHKVKALHSNVPWPKPTSSADDEKSRRAQPRQQKSDTRPEKQNRAGTAKAEVGRSDGHDSKSSKVKTGGIGALWEMIGQTPLKCFTTRNGYFGIGPAWLEEGDRIFLIPGGTAPIIFAHVDDALQRKIRQMQVRVERKRKWVADKLENPKKAEKKQMELDQERQKIRAIEKDMAGLKARLGQRDAYMLVGEAYIEGVMHGELAGSRELQLKRYEIV